MPLVLFRSSAKRAKIIPNTLLFLSLANNKNRLQVASEKNHHKGIENKGSKTGSTCSQSPRGQEIGTGDHIRKAKSHCVSLASSSLVRVISIKNMSLRSISFILIA